MTPPCVQLIRSSPAWLIPWGSYHRSQPQAVPNTLSRQGMNVRGLGGRGQRSGARLRACRPQRAFPASPTSSDPHSTPGLCRPAALGVFTSSMVTQAKHPPAGAHKPSPHTPNTYHVTHCIIHTCIYTARLHTQPSRDLPAGEVFEKTQAVPHSSSPRLFSVPAQLALGLLAGGWWMPGSPWPSCDSSHCAWQRPCPLRERKAILEATASTWPRQGVRGCLEAIPSPHPTLWGSTALPRRGHWAGPGQTLIRAQGLCQGSAEPGQGPESRGWADIWEGGPEGCQDRLPWDSSTDDRLPAALSTLSFCVPDATFSGGLPRPPPSALSLHPVHCLAASAAACN